MDWLNITLTLLSIIIPVFATLYTVNNRIKNENRENHMPYIVLDKIESINKIDTSSYYLEPMGANFLKKHPIFDIENVKESESVNVKFWLKNIGYGVATNIRFYDLTTGEGILGNQENDSKKNQKLFTTYDIASNDTNKVQVKILSCVDNFEDNIKILCVYKDLNENYYDFIININIKKHGYYDFYAYQRTSRSYQKLMKQYKNNHKKIMKVYLNK